MISFYMHLHRRNEPCFPLRWRSFFSPHRAFAVLKVGGFFCAVLQKEIFLQKGLTFADGFGIIGVLSLFMLCMGEIQKEVY